MSNFSYTAHEQGHQLDLLGRPIKVGDRVLTKGYGSTSMNNFATVKSVDRKSISIDVEYTHWVNLYLDLKVILAYGIPILTANLSLPPSL